MAWLTGLMRRVCGGEVGERERRGMGEVGEWEDDRSVLCDLSIG